MLPGCPSRPSIPCWRHAALLPWRPSALTSRLPRVIWRRAPQASRPSKHSCSHSTRKSPGMQSSSCTASSPAGPGHPLPGLQHFLWHVLPTRHLYESLTCESQAVSMSMMSMTADCVSGLHQMGGTAKDRDHPGLSCHHPAQRSCQPPCPRQRA